mgnify:FL=1
MTELWDVRTLAGHLLSVMPRFGRAMGQYMLTQNTEDETTIMQGFTLFALLEEPMTVSDLARKRHVSLQSASKLVQVLVDRGLVTRVRKEDDRRQYLLEVSEEGRACAEEMKAMFLNYAARLMDRLTAEEIAAAQIFLPALERILDSIAPPDSNSRCT